MRNFTLTLLSLLVCSGLLAQQPNLWRLANEAAIGRDLFQETNSRRPTAYKIFEVQEPAFVASLRNAPSETSVSVNRSSFVAAFPMPDGSIRHFRLVNAPCMEPGLSRKFPDIQSYAGQGVEDPTQSIRISASRFGVNASIMSPTQPTIYIDKMAGNYYRVVSRNNLTPSSDHFRCLTDDMPSPSGAGNHPENTPDNNADDGILRTYRLAMISGAEFSLHFIPPGGLPTLADSVNAVLAAQNSHVTRTNQVYERDFGVRLLLVANNNLLIYFNPATDPIANPNSPNGVANQAAIDAAIGVNNYDIGHTESKGSDNGNAGCIGCVCNNANKGRGWTVYSNPSLLEFFVIDYLTHEIGHQFGANHTFSFNLEGTGVNVEPGSGVTIMGYAGIVAGQNVALHSIEIFSVKSIEQVTNYIKTGTGSTCDVEINNGNIAPVVNAGTDYTIPFSTPFKLTGTASDANGDVMTYNWEQIDNRSGAFPSIPVSTATNGPMFRTYLNYTIPERTFPDLQYILTGANGFQWEVLPSVARTMNFRFIARDNRANGGQNESDDMVVTVAGTAGPFLVTSQNSATNWTAGATETITWSVNNTTAAPVNCSNVNILFSSDGGNTFTMVLANTPNDGTQNITVPLVTTTQGRIKVEAVGNIFFDINNANINVAPPPFGFTLVAPAPVTSPCPADAAMVATLNTVSNGGFSNAITLSASGNPAGTTVSFGTNPVNPGSSSTVTLSGTNTLSPGTYNVTVSGTATGAPNASVTVAFVINPGSGPSITAQPANQTVCAGANATFSVTATGVTGHQWQVSTNGGGTWTNISGATTASYTASAVTTGMNNNQYRVILTGQCGSTTSAAATLTVNTAPAITGQPVNVAVCSGSGASFTVTATGSGIGYQWEMSTDGGTTWNPIGGATSATYTIASTTTGMNNNRYRCIVTGTCTPAAVSSAAILTVNSSVTVTGNPSNATVCEGTNISFTASASGTGLSYQWEVSTNGGASWSNVANGGVYSGATTPTLTITGVPPTFNTNRYRCTISSPPCTPGVTSAAILTVNTFPVITAQPANQTICAGGNPTFSVTATTGVGTLTYQWQVSTDNGTTWTNLAGATSASYAQTNVPVGQNGYRFRVIVTAGCGSTTSNAASITVNAFPVVTLNDLPATVCVSDQPFALSATPAGGTWSGTGVTGSTFSPAASGVGTRTVSYAVTNAGCVTTRSSVVQVNACTERQRLLSDRQSVIIFPNPSSGDVNIRINSDLYNFLGVRIFNAAGQLVRNQEFAGLNFGSVRTISMGNLGNGVYQFYLYNNQNGFISRGVSVIFLKK